MVVLWKQDKNGQCEMVAGLSMDDNTYIQLEKRYANFGGILSLCRRYKRRNSINMLRYIIKVMLRSISADKLMSPIDYNNLINNLVNGDIDLCEFYYSLICDSEYSMYLKEEESEMTILLDTNKIGTNWKEEYDNRHRREREEIKKNPLHVEITKIVVHNDKAMIVYFEDGTFTKAVCSDNDVFSFDAGFQVCLLKKLYGEKEYHRYMRKTRKFYDNQEKIKQNKVDEKKKRREEQEKRHQKNLARQNKNRENFRNDIAEAVANAISKNTGKDADDLK